MLVVLLVIGAAVAAADDCTIEIDGNTFALGKTQKTIGAGGLAIKSTSTITYYVGVCGAISPPRAVCAVKSGCIAYQDTQNAACYCVGLVQRRTTNFDKTTNTLNLAFDGGEDGRAVTLALACGSEGTPTASETSTSKKYLVNWTLKGACVVGPSSALTGVEIFVLAAFVSLVAYCVFGSIFMWQVKHHSGSDVIPNKTFWAQLPWLVKDGVLYTLGLGKVCFYRATGRPEIRNANASTVAGADV
eukprot:c40386_g1_i1.p1 GENE.c40386_g1_i1~~c40386_g1_i1.p1  ORF type:complete len:245 (+),score=56.68 c40386_g1_i1:38-772(+)